MPWSIHQLEARLKELKEQRKAGALDERAYYRGLLELAVELAQSLIEEMSVDGNMATADIRKQLPLILAFVEDQITRFRDRENART